jgi:hypothetical protein
MLQAKQNKTLLHAHIMHVPARQQVVVIAIVLCLGQGCPPIYGP